MEQTRNIEEVLEKDKIFLSTFQGRSMFPMLRQGVDSIVIEPLKGEPKPMDVLLYRNHGKYILHRLIRNLGDHYLILGDNRITTEDVNKTNVIGKLSYFFRGDKEIHLNPPFYQLYVLLYCRPWRIRILMKKVYIKIRKTWKG